MKNTTTLYSYDTGHYITNDGKRIMLSMECTKEIYEEQLRINWQTAHEYEVPNDKVEEFRKYIQGDKSIRRHE